MPHAVLQHSLNAKTLIIVVVITKFDEIPVT